NMILNRGEDLRVQTAPVLFCNGLQPFVQILRKTHAKGNLVFHIDAPFWILEITGDLRLPGGPCYANHTTRTPTVSARATARATASRITVIRAFMSLGTLNPPFDVGGPAMIP